MLATTTDDELAARNGIHSSRAAGAAFDFIVEIVHQLVHDPREIRLGDETPETVELLNRLKESVKGVLMAAEGTHSGMANLHLPASPDTPNSDVKPFQVITSETSDTAPGKIGRIALLSPEQQAFILSAAFNCPSDVVSATVRRALMEYCEEARSRHSSGSGSPDDHSAPSQHAVDAVNTGCKSALVNGGFMQLLDSPRDLRPHPPSLALPTISRGYAFPDDETRALCGRIFAESGEFTNVDRLMMAFPPFLEVHAETWNFLMIRDGPLSLTDRIIVAILAAARHQCEYLIRRYFLFAQSVPAFPHQWLQHGVPPRFKVLEKLIALMAHTPWKLDDGVINELVSGTADGSPPTQTDLETWSPPEVVHAAAIAAHVVALSGIVEVLHVPFEPSTAVLPPAICSPNQISLRFADREPGSANTHTEGEGPTKVNYSNVRFDLFRTHDIQYQDRIRRTTKKSERDNCSITTAQFGWSAQASSVIDNFCPGIANLFSSEKVMYDQLTSAIPAESLRFHSGSGAQQVPTSSSNFTNGQDMPASSTTFTEESDDEEFDSDVVWHALFVYVQNLLGLVHYDFDYASINKILDKDVKRFAQKASALPEDATVDDLIWSGEASADPQLKLAVALCAFVARREAMMVVFAYHFREYLRQQ